MDGPPRLDGHHRRAARAVGARLGRPRAQLWDARGQRADDRDFLLLRLFALAARLLRRRRRRVPVAPRLLHVLGSEGRVVGARGEVVLRDLRRRHRAVAHPGAGVLAVGEHLQVVGPDAKRDAGPDDHGGVVDALAALAHEGAVGALVREAHAALLGLEGHVAPRDVGGGEHHVARLVAPDEDGPHLVDAEPLHPAVGGLDPQKDGLRVTGAHMGGPQSSPPDVSTGWV